MQGLIGKTGCKVTGSFDVIWGKFNVRAGKTLIIADEMEGLQAHTSANLMKESITETEVCCERKGKDAYFVPAACNFMICSSNSEGNVVKIEPTDRRFVVFEKFDKKTSTPITMSSSEPWPIRTCYDPSSTSFVGYEPGRVSIRIERPLPLRCVP